jgi:hypothetical protein
VTAVPRRGTGPSDDGPAVPPAVQPFAAAVAVADAVLYEGYLLYPYRRSSAKNRVRWQFGVLAPRGFVEAAGPADTGVAGSADAWHQRTEVLLEARDDAEVVVRVRFLHLQRRLVERYTPGGWVPVDELEIDGERYLTFDEAVPREFDVVTRLADLSTHPHEVALSVAGERTVEPLGDRAGRVVRESCPVVAALRLEVEPAAAPFRLHRLRCVLENTSAAVPASRPEALRSSLVAAHTLFAVRGGRFVSLLEPPLWATEAAAACDNVHTFPVLCGRDVVLSSPIILYDHPRIAPESPGPLFDSGEIDEILSLRTLTLTEEEKREARATDPQAAALLDRVDSLPDELLARLHGAVRSLRPVPPQPQPLVVGGVRITVGSRVRLQPRRHGTDAQDRFLAGRTATVDEVLDDVDDGRFVAVTLDDDPGADLLREYGRHYQFSPDEIEALPIEALP